MACYNRRPTKVTISHQSGPCDDGRQAYHNNNDILLCVCVWHDLSKEASMMKNQDALEWSRKIIDIYKCIFCIYPKRIYIDTYIRVEYNHNIME